MKVYRLLARGEELVGSASFKRPLLSVNVSMCVSVCVSVCPQLWC